MTYRFRGEPIRSTYSGMNAFTSVLLAVLLTVSYSASAQQEPAPAPNATQAPNGPPAPGTSTPSGKGKKPIPSYLIIGTVFDEKARVFPGVQVRIRENGTKKYRWDTYTDSRGEFAVRVPPGHEYDVLIHMKNYDDQNESADAKVDVQKRLSIKLQPRGQAKTGVKL